MITLMSMEKLFSEEEEEENKNVKISITKYISIYEKEVLLQID